MCKHVFSVMILLYPNKILQKAGHGDLASWQNEDEQFLLRKFYTGAEKPTCLWLIAIKQQKSCSTNSGVGSFITFLSSIINRKWRYFFRALAAILSSDANPISFVLFQSSHTQKHIEYFESVTFFKLLLRMGVQILVSYNCECA